MAKHGRLVYFEHWIDPVAERMVEGEPDVEIVRIGGADDPGAAFAGAHWYQLTSTRGEIPAEFRVDAHLLQRAADLLVVSTHGAGYDTVDVDACTAAGVLVVNQSGGNREAVAQYTLGAMLMLSRRAMEADLRMRRERGWRREDFTGRDLTAKTVGLIGLGNVGRRVAALARGTFGMRVLAYDPYLDEAAFTEAGAERATLEALLAESDFVSVHCPRTRETEQMLGAAEFARMRPSAFVVNTARGGILDEYALAESLRVGRLAGAAIDVWEAEPPPLDHPLLALDNVMVSPHIAGVSVEARQTMAAWAVEQWRGIWRGERPERLVNPEAWPGYVERRRSILGT